MDTGYYLEDLPKKIPDIDWRQERKKGICAVRWYIYIYIYTLTHTLYRHVQDMCRGVKRQ